MNFLASLDILCSHWQDFYNLIHVCLDAAARPCEGPYHERFACDNAAFGMVVSFSPSCLHLDPGQGAKFCPEPLGCELPPCKAEFGPVI